ncbi:DUF1206 domain-containing protein [Actinomadura scrupuli]|uniref:DUF1206 domain-containing protein n=1 Tax=Actinomadura scrupuli TaxID=559629 RepID=UPI003D9646F0
MRSANRTVQEAGSEAATSRWMQWLARAGLVARGVNYVLIGILAVQIGLGGGGKEADRVGALHEVAKHSGGTFVLWLLVVGFGGLSLWRLAEAAYGQADPDGHKATKRLASLARGVFYAFVCVSIIGFLLSIGGQSSSDKQSKDFSARLMDYTGGRWLVLLVGLVIAGAAVAIVVGAIRKKFRKHLKLGEMSAHTRKVVETMGAVGYAARGIVFGVVGVFLAIAAINFDPKDSQGIDGALRKLAETPLGPWLLIAVAVGLVIFGVYSCCEARWRRVQPGQSTQNA